MSKLSRVLKTSKGIFNRGMKPSGERGVDPKWSKIAFNLSGFNQFGLYSQDMIHEAYPIIESALRRLPVDVLDARTFRLVFPRKYVPLSIVPQFVDKLLREYSPTNGALCSRTRSETMHDSAHVNFTKIIRAVQLDFLEARLPKSEWITYEEDLEYRYLDPYLKEIAAERNEIYEFGCVNYSEKDWPAE